MNLRIAYYVVAFAISLAAFGGAYGYATARGEVAAARAANAAARRGPHRRHSALGQLSPVGN